MIQHKPGVRLLGVHHLALHAAYVADPIWMAAGAPATVITSGMEGRHSAGSGHYRGLAIDLRTNTMATDKATAAVAALKAALGPDYVVLYEAAGTPNAHCHVEYRPQEAYG
jgi:hypothetical protein